MARRAVELSEGKDAAALDARASASAETGDFAAAETDAKAAIKLATSGGDSKLAADIRDRLALYRDGKPYRLRSRLKNQIQNPKPSKSQTHRIEESKQRSSSGAATSNSKRKS